ncbi:hypothetical protein V5P93_000653 [Actinokineospora auranticolor]|uniref:Uncharacterized protein n=1 Tax=Actinokineospora auranticolor TaxID=155976 RepID=A0A2S6GZ72_9PSEU|nr:hypothetical protein [Actinokineospora auranticolor]PPK70466.1 hypothetical protein CLV40_102381 [Actinokineospora auranticolor]
MHHPIPLDTFPTALTGAIEDRGMSLDQLQRKLAAHGVRVSLSTLSYWRRGRTRPERPESLRAVEVIEEVLALPRGCLTGLLGPRKPRGRWVSRGGVVRPHETLWDDTSGLPSVLAELGEPGAGELTYLSVHDRHFVDVGGRDVRTVVRVLVRSEVDSLGSMVVLHRADPGDHALPVLLAPVGCALGRVRSVPSSRFTAAEVLFDRRLSAGQTAVFEYEVRWFGDARADRYSRACRRGVRDYLVEVNFHPALLPTSSYAFTQDAADEPEVRLANLEVGTFGGIHAVITDTESPIVGVRWTWPA